MNCTQSPIFFDIPPVSRSIIMNQLVKLPNSRRNFTPEEDQRLILLVKKFGTNNWKQVSRNMYCRSPRQCKERFTTYLSPDVNLNPWTPEEDNLLMALYDKFGSKWVKISKFFKGRRDNNLKNRWYTHLSKLKSINKNAHIFKIDKPNEILNATHDDNFLPSTNNDFSSSPDGNVSPPLEFFCDFFNSPDDDFSSFIDLNERNENLC